MSPTVRPLLVGLLLAVAPVSTDAQESFWDDYQTSSSETAPALTSRHDNLVLYVRPDLRAASRTIPYGSGWEVPYLQQLVRTLVPQTLHFKFAAEFPAVCEEAEPYPTLDTALVVAAGEEWTYLHYAGEGFVVGVVQGKVCEFEGPRELFRNDHPQPEIQIWFEVNYADGTSPGWLLLDDGAQVTVSFRY